MDEEGRKQAMPENRGTSSPKRERNGASKTCDYSLAILRKFCADSRVKGIVRSEQSKIVKLCPGSLGTGNAQMAAFAALRVAFPFCTVSAVECVASGNTEFQILVSTDSEAFLNAKRQYSETKMFRAIRFISNTSLIFSVLSFMCLLQTAAIRPP